MYDYGIDDIRDEMKHKREMGVLHLQALRFHRRYMTHRDWLNERAMYVSPNGCSNCWVFHRQIVAQLRKLKPGRLP